MAQLLYGSGLRLMECLRLRIKDVDLAQRQSTVCLGKGHKAPVPRELQPSAADRFRRQSRASPVWAGCVAITGRAIQKQPMVAFTVLRLQVDKIRSLWSGKLPSDG